MTQAAAVLTDEIVEECRRRYGSGQSEAALAREFGVAQCTLHNAVTGITWQHVTEPPVRERGYPSHRAAPAKVTEDAVREIRARHATGTRASALADQFGYSRSVVSGIINRKTWQHVA